MLQTRTDSPPYLPALGLERVKFQEIDRSSLQDPVKSRRDPTQKQLCQCIMMVKERFPECKLDRVILLLHNVLLKEEMSSKDTSEMFESSRSKKGLLSDSDSYLSEEQGDFQRKKMRQEYALKFQNSEANPRFYQQRQIARLFCSKGYGYPTAREYLGDSITPNRYNNVITTIVRLSYRKLEYYIIRHMQPNLQMITRDELKMIKTPLVNCRNWMTDRQAENFHRFVRLTYKIRTEEPQRCMVIQLYDAVIQQLRKRNVTYRPHRRGGDPNSWSPQMDTQLITNYLRQPDTLILQQDLSGLFSTHRQCFELGRLRLRLQRLLRLALRKIYADRDKFAMNEPSTLSEYLVCKISRSQNALNVRKRLLSYYLDGDTTAMKLRWVREVLDDFVRGSRGDIEEIEDSSCELVAKEELKAQQIVDLPEKEQDPVQKKNQNSFNNKKQQDP